jgi:hypothetical protein
MSRMTHSVVAVMLLVGAAAAVSATSQEPVLPQPLAENACLGFSPWQMDLCGRATQPSVSPEAYGDMDV